MDANFLKDLAEVRSRTYWFLSTLYLKKPDKKFLDELKSRLSELEEQDIFDDVFMDSVNLIRKGLEGDMDELSQRLAVEFTRLFRGIRKGYGPPPPYESVYRGENRVMGETTLKVIEFYSQAGFGVIDEDEGPQDYIGVELKFMSLLCYREFESWKDGKMGEGRRYLELEKKFLDEHILRWVPEFCHKVEVEAREEFYIGVAGLTEDFIRTDAKNLEILLDEIKS